MKSMSLYIYETNSGLFLYQDTGDVEHIIYDIDDTKDFTLAMPPMDGGIYRWLDGKWVKDAD